MKWPLIDMEEMIKKGLIKLGRGDVISKLDIAACPGPFPIYSSAQMNNGKFGEYGKYMFDQELITWSVDGGGQLFYRPKHKFSVTNVAGTLEILDSSQLDCKYLHYVLSDKHSRLKFDWIQKAHPSVIRRLYKEIPLPPLEDQLRIVHLLGKVVGLIAQRKHHLQQFDDLLKSVFLEMFGDPISNPKKFPVRNLSEFYINPKEGTKCGPFGSALKKEELVDSGVPVWNMDNIDPAGRMVLPFRMWLTEEKYKALASYSVIDGDIIISRAGTVGKMCVARMNKEPAIISTNLIRLRLGNKLRPLHFVSLMTYCKGRVGRLKTGADGAFTHMNTGILDKLEFPYPPIELQDQFAAIVEKVEDLKSRYQQSLADLETLYGALSQKAFKGELDLSRVPVTSEHNEPIEEIETEIAAVTETPVKPAIELPTPSAVDDLYDAKGRMEVIVFWLDSYLEQLRGLSFSAQDFMEKAQQKLWKLLEDDAYQLSITEYDHVKALIFRAIEDGRLSQKYDDIAGNRILITIESNPSRFKGVL